MPKDYRTPRLPLRGLMVGAGCSIRAPLTAWPKVRGCQRCCSRTHRWPIRSCFFAPGVGMTCRRRWWLSPPARGSKIAGGLLIYDRRQSRKSQHASPPDAHGRVALQAPSSGAAPDESKRRASRTRRVPVVRLSRCSSQFASTWWPMGLVARSAGTARLGRARALYGLSRR